MTDMKRFPYFKDAKGMKIYDSHNKLLAEIKPEGERLHLHDQKNNRIQYTIGRKIQDSQNSFSLFQGDVLVGEVVPTVTVLNFIVNNAKYGNNIEVLFQDKTNFTVKRDGAVISIFCKTAENVGYLDISKGERRNFSFAVVALFVYWSEASPVKESNTKPPKSKSAHNKSPVDEDKVKEKEKSSSMNDKKTSTNNLGDDKKTSTNNLGDDKKTSTNDLGDDNSEKSENSNEEEGSDPNHSHSESSSSGGNGSKKTEIRSDSHSYPRTLGKITS